MNREQLFISHTQTLHIVLSSDQLPVARWLEQSGPPRLLLGEVVLAGKTARIYADAPGSVRPRCDKRPDYSTAQPCPLTHEQIAALEALVLAFSDGATPRPPLTGQHDYDAPQAPTEANGASATDDEAPAVELSPRERDVLTLMARGMRNHQIATELLISVGTVKKHVSSVLTKLCVSSRTEAVAQAVRANLIPLE